MHLRSLVCAVALSAVASACGGDDEPAGPTGGARDPFPSMYCPGSEGCTGTGDGVFKVGAARRSITPDLDAAEGGWVDENMNNEYDSGEPFEDDNDNGKFDAVWMAGFGNGRPATGIHSDTWVRAIAFEWNDIRIAIAVVDCVGWMVDEIDQTRELLDPSLEIDHLLVQATHVHETQDTLGLWGRQELVPGTDPDYQRRIREQTAAAVAEAVGNLEPVTMSYATAMATDESGSSRNFVGDGRDPVVLDPTITVIQFGSVANPGETVATMVHWTAHPEFSGSDNNLITADYIYMLREAIENGLPAEPDRSLPAIDGLGGEVVFVQGPLGGQIGPHGTAPIDTDGTEITQSGLEKADAVGRNVGRLALEAITSTDGVTDVANPSLEFRTGELDLAVENTFYHVASLVNVFDRQFYGHDETKPLGPSNIPFIASRTTYVRIGTVGIITAPGELHPELFYGGYDGSMTYGDDFIQPDNPNPPAIANAPTAPYLKDLVLDNPGVDLALCFGLGEDMVGYIVPSYNYILNENTPYIEEADGDHYEETNSVGPKIDEQAVGSMRALVQWRPPAE